MLFDHMTHWCWSWHNVMSIKLLMGPFPLFGQDNKQGATCIFGHVTQLALKSASCDTNKIINDNIPFVTPLVSPSHDANGIVNDTITFIRSR